MNFYSKIFLSLVFMRFGFAAGYAERPVVINQGQALAEMHCVRCHLLPDSSDLPKRSWPFAIDWMAHYFGHATFTNALKSIVFDELVPPEPLLSTQELNQIQQVFESTAEEEMAASYVGTNALCISPLFSMGEDSFYKSARTVSAVLIDEEEKVVLAYDDLEKSVDVFNPYGVNIQRVPTLGSVAWIEKSEERYIITLVGTLANQGSRGGVMEMRKVAPDEYQKRYLLSDWYRLADTERADVDGDGHLDWVLSGFGSRAAGGLFIFYGGGSWQLQKGQPLYEGMGTLNAVAKDFDGDGDVDVMALMAQGLHELVWYENVGARTFVRHLIMKKRPSFGSNGFRLKDLDGDEDLDLILYAGNNLEMVNPPIRPYHGVYVYENRGALEFKQRYFFHMPGATAIEVEDFNGDGHVDIAVVSGYPDWRQERPLTFALLQGGASFNFEPMTVAGTEGMQWMSLDSGDMDGDGDLDLVLGSQGFAPEMGAHRNSNWQKSWPRPPLQLLINNLK